MQFKKVGEQAQAMVTTIALSHWCSFTLVTLLSDAWYVRDTTVGTTSSSRAAEGFTESFGQISATCRSQQSQGKISPIVAIAAPPPQVQRRRYVTQNVNLKKYEWMHSMHGAFGGSTRRRDNDECRERIAAEMERDLPAGDRPRHREKELPQELDPSQEWGKRSTWRVQRRRRSQHLLQVWQLQRRKCQDPRERGRSRFSKREIRTGVKRVGDDIIGLLGALGNSNDDHIDADTLIDAE